MLSVRNSGCASALAHLDQPAPLRAVEIKRAPHAVAFERLQLPGPGVVACDVTPLKGEVQRRPKGRAVPVVATAGAATLEHPLFPICHMPRAELGELHLGDRIVVDESAEPEGCVARRRLAALGAQLVDVGFAGSFDALRLRRPAHVQVPEPQLCRLPGCVVALLLRDAAEVAQRLLIVARAVVRTRKPCSRRCFRQSAETDVSALSEALPVRRAPGLEVRALTHSIDEVGHGIQRVSNYPDETASERWRGVLLDPL
jgi:hypothetical protein